MPNIKLGANAADRPQIPVSVPVEKVPARVDYEVLDVKQFVTVDPENGLVVSAEQLAEMQAETNLNALVSAGLLVIEGGE